MASASYVTSPLKSNHDGKFGKHLLAEFAFKDGYVNFNYGSFGAAPNEVLKVHRQLTERAESSPEVWFRDPVNGYRALLAKARSSLGKYLNADPNDLVFVENASAGVNATLRSLKFKPGDKVLITNTAYPMVKNLLTYLKQKDGIEVVEVPIIFPVTSDNDIIQPIAKVFLQERGGDIELTELIFSRGN